MKDIYYAENRILKYLRKPKKHDRLVKEIMDDCVLIGDMKSVLIFDKDELLIDVSGLGDLNMSSLVFGEHKLKAFSRLEFDHGDLDKHLKIYKNKYGQEVAISMKGTLYSDIDNGMFTYQQDPTNIKTPIYVYDQNICIAMVLPYIERNQINPELSKGE